MTTYSGGTHPTGDVPRHTAEVPTEPMVTTAGGPVVAREEIAVPAGGDQRRDPIRWSAVWAGLIMALATFILVQLIFYALGWLTFEQGNQGTTAGLVSALIGLFAFFVGGAVAGGTSIWHGAREGMVHGMLVWALGVVGILFLTVFGGGALLGSLANAVAQTGSLQEADLSDVEFGRAAGIARDAAGWAVLGLLVYLIAAVAGGVLGVKTGSRGRKS